MADLVKFWPVALFVVQGLMAWVLWSLRRSFVSRDEFSAFSARHGERHDKIDGQLREGETRFAVIDLSIRESALTRAEMHEARLQIEGLRGDLKVVQAMLERLERINDVMVDGHMVVKS